MTICLTIANELALNGTYDNLTENLTEYEQDEYMPYLLNEVNKYVISSPELNFRNLKLVSELLDSAGQQT